MRSTVPSSAVGPSWKPSSSVTQPATVTACDQGCLRCLAIMPGSIAMMTITAIVLAARMISTSQANRSRKLMAFLMLATPPVGGADQAMLTRTALQQHRH